MFQRMLSSGRMLQSAEELLISPRIGGRSSVSGVVATVFGGTGTLGRAVINRLGKIGSSVIVPYRGEEKAFRHLKVMGDLGQIVPQVIDIRDEQSMRAAVRRSNVVVNLLGRGYGTKNYSLQEVNVDAARLIAEASAEAGVERLVHVSALGIDGEHSTSAFARSKLEGERAVRDAFPDATVLRPSEVFSGYDQLVMRLATWVRFHYAFLIAKPGRKFAPLHVSEFAAAVMAALAEPLTAGKTYELAGPDVYTHREFLHAIATHVRISCGHGFAPPDAFTRAFIGAVYERFRTPALTRDQFDWYCDGDALPSPNALQLDALGIHGRTHFEDVALSMLQVFQPAKERHLV
jgi:NADH dehydrogenase (ubiquinone) 1 alpha subcomplex subunit 9